MARLTRLEAKAMFGHRLFLQIMFYWTIAIVICLCIICGCFHNSRAKFSRLTETTWPTESKIVTIWLYTEEEGEKPTTSKARERTSGQRPSLITMSHRSFPTTEVSKQPHVQTKNHASLILWRGLVCS